MSDAEPVVIRPAVVGDAAGIAAVHVRSWQAAYRGLMPQDYLDGLDPADRRPRWQQQLTDPGTGRDEVLVAESDRGICGFSAYGPTRDEDQDARLVGEIRAIYLAPEAFGTGVGRRLMAASVERLARAGFALATLWVLDSNARARRFYEVAGFRADGAVMADDRAGFRLEEVRYRRSLRP